MHAGVLAGGAWASGARSQPIRHRSGLFRIATRRGYAAAEWLGSTWRFQVRLQQPLGISPAPATQPISVRALSERLDQRWLKVFYDLIEHEAFGLMPKGIAGKVISRSEE